MINITSVYLSALEGIHSGDLPTTSAGPATLAKVLAIVFGIAGAFAFLMIIVSGLRYILSAGSPDKVSKAKNGIIYALVGLVIAVMAEAIVAFVVKRL
jgi:hypothetical protein